MAEKKIDEESLAKLAEAIELGYAVFAHPDTIQEVQELVSFIISPCSYLKPDQIVAVKPLTFCPSIGPL